MTGWLELGLVVDRAEVDLRSAELFELGAAGLQEDHLPGEAPPPRQPWDTGPVAVPTARALLRAWFSPELANTAREAVLARWGAAATFTQVVEEDWANAWKAGFSRLVIDERLAVAPPWEALPGDLQIEPGMAFGTGDHPTTRACLEAVARFARPGERCLDVGSGTGVLALAAARLGMEAVGIDVDPDAIRAANENAALNGISVAFSNTPLSALGGQWELVVANLFAEVLVALAPELQRVTGRRLVLAGILADRAHLLEAAFPELRLSTRIQEGDWVHMVWER